jgi:hypothetical protein
MFSTLSEKSVQNAAIPSSVSPSGSQVVGTNTELVPGSFAKVWTVRSSTRGSLRGWAVARRNFLEGPDAGCRGRRTLNTFADRSKFSSNLFSHAFSSETKASGRFGVSSAPLGRGNATLAAEQETFDGLPSENLAWVSDIEVDDPELSEIELGISGGTVASGVVPAIEDHDRWAPVVTVKDAERVFNRVKSSRGYLKEAVNYQLQ